MAGYQFTVKQQQQQQQQQQQHQQQQQRSVWDKNRPKKDKKNSRCDPFKVKAWKMSLLDISKSDGCRDEKSPGQFKNIQKILISETMELSVAEMPLEVWHDGRR